ncbi:MAG: PEP-CTERM sorting domain-containing protein [Phycisphaerales bacterium]|nr:PEP-CTERM sorting domain-containing protein [Phycisphaerales bacterium]
MKALLAMTAFVGFAAVANAGIGVETYGAAAPPASVNGTPVNPAPFDGRIFSDVPSAPLAAGDGNVLFSSPLSTRQIGFGWATWSHGYTGNCYYTNGLTSVTMTFDMAIKAFQFYGEPNPFGVFQMTATGSDGSASQSSQQFPDGSSGAAGWGFYGTGGSSIASIAVSSDVDFAIGEFASTKVPAPASLGLIGLGGLVAGRRRR